MSDTVGRLICAAIDRLRSAGVDSPKLDARLLLSHAAELSVAAIAVDPQRTISADVVDRFDAMLIRREAREPVSKILGLREFWSLEFEVSADTLDPRPDSETLVEWALEVLPSEAPVRLIDFGTGTGCLLLSLLHERPAWRGVGVDISEKALTVARRNAERLGLAARADFCLSNWDEAIPSGKWDAIISNPPYIAQSEMADLSKEVRHYDPEIALTDGADGLTAYRKLAEIAAEKLTSSGVILVEHGYRQHDQVNHVFDQVGLTVLAGRRDLGGNMRCAGAVSDR